MNELKLLQKESNGSSKFNGELVMTRGFMIEFSNLASEIAINGLAKVITERVNSPEGADYLQVLTYKGITFWIIDDIDVVTVLLPEDY